MKGPIVLEKRLAGTTGNLWLIRIVAILAAVLVAGIILTFMGKSPVQVFSKMVSRVIDPRFGLADTVAAAIPLIFCGLGASIAFRMKLWNIGGEGQLFMGAFAASGVALTFPTLPALILIPMMMIAAVAAGALWALISAIPKAYLGVNETITTLMLNYVAIVWVEYLVQGPWKDPNQQGFPISTPISTNAYLPALGRTNIHLGLVFGLLLAVGMYILVNRSKWGYEVRVIGESTESAQYAGMSVERNILIVMAISGAIAGLAGMSQLAGVAHRMEVQLSSGYGYTGIIIAWLSRLSPFGIVIASFLFGGLMVGGYAVQTMGVPASVATMIQGLILFSIIGFDLFAQYKLIWKGGR